MHFRQETRNLYERSTAFSNQHLLPVISQFHVPIRQVQEMSPAIVVVKSQVDLDKRSPLRPFGFADQPHARFLRRAVGFLRVASNA